MSMIQVSVTDYLPDPANPAKLKLQTFLKLVQTDNSPEAQAVQDALRQLQADQKSGTASPETLQADQAALRDAIKALQQRRRLDAVGSDADAQAAQGVQRRRPPAEAPVSAQARADFKSLASTLENFEPVQRQTRLLHKAAKTGTLINGEA